MHIRYFTVKLSNLSYPKLISQDILTVVFHLWYCVSISAPYTSLHFILTFSGIF